MNNEEKMKQSLIISIIVLLSAGFYLQSCHNNDPAKQRQKELALLNDYIARYDKVHGVNLQPSLSGLYYVEEKEGYGDTIAVGDRVQVWYNTYLLSDTLLVDTNMPDGHKYEPLEFVVAPPGTSSVVEGLNEAVKNMKAGGKAFLIIPSQIGYGQNGTYGVPAFSTLLMDVEIYKVFRASEGY